MIDAEPIEASDELLADISKRAKGHGPDDWATAVSDRSDLLAHATAVADRDRYKASLDQFLRDTSEAMSCLPGCDSQAHEELCPVVNPAAAWRMLNADRDRYRAESEQAKEIVRYYRGSHDEDVGLRTTSGCGCFICKRARALLAPPTPAAQGPTP